MAPGSTRSIPVLLPLQPLLGFEVKTFAEVSAIGRRATTRAQLLTSRTSERNGRTWHGAPRSEWALGTPRPTMPAASRFCSFFGMPLVLIGRIPGTGQRRRQRSTAFLGLAARVLICHPCTQVQWGTRDSCESCSRLDVQRPGAFPGGGGRHSPDNCQRLLTGSKHGPTA